MTRKRHMAGIVGLAMATFALVAFAQEMSPAVMQRMMEEAGGRIVVPGSQMGTVVYVNCQKRAKREWLEASLRYFQQVSRFAISIKEGEFAFPGPSIQGNASLFVVDDDKLPALLCAPEDRWVAVNIAKLSSNAEAFFEARVKKELARGFAILCGATNSQYPGALTGGIRGVEDLDRHVDSRLPMDVLVRFPSYMKNFGVTPAKLSTYRAACKQGWAPAPTNEYQKAIWEKVKADKERGPTNPITIPPLNAKK